MKEHKVVTIGNQKYDSATGMPIGTVSPKTPQKPITAKTKQSSRVKSFHTASRGSMRKTMDIARSKHISHFSAQTDNIISQPATTKPKNRPMDIKTIKHPLAAKVEKTRSQHSDSAKTTPSKTAKQIKEEAIAEAMRKADDNKTQENPRKIKKQPKKSKKTLLIICCILTVLISAGIATYFFLPTISIYIASTQTKVNAKLPTYTPDGYQLNGPASSSNGQVTINFAATSGNNYFKLTQTNSSWDSSALKNKVDDASKGEFITMTFDGLTIFTYDDNATWVNDGTLYTISGNSPLSSDQIQQIAISLCS